METSNCKPGSVLTFKSALSVRDILYKEMTACDGPAFYLDLSEVEQCDSAGLALLFEVRKLCWQSKKKLKIINIPTKVMALAEFYGVKDILEIK